MIALQLFGGVPRVLRPLQVDGVESSRSLLEYVRAGGEIGVIIILLSVVALSLTVAQLYLVRRSRLAPQRTIQALQPLVQAGDLDGAAQLCALPDHQSFLSRVFGSALVRCRRSPFGMLELRGALEESGQLEVARLYRLTDGIGLIASVAPMLGLLGTVIGMVGAFDTITLADGPARPDQLAGNISKALITTVLGLIVAIPATAAHTFVRNRIDSLTAEIGEVVEELASLAEAATRGSEERSA